MIDRQNPAYIHRSLFRLVIFPCDRLSHRSYPSSVAQPNHPLRQHFIPTSAAVRSGWTRGRWVRRVGGRREKQRARKRERERVSVGVHEGWSWRWLVVGGGKSGVCFSANPSSPHLGRTGANVKRFRDVKADTRAAHFGPTTSATIADTCVFGNPRIIPVASYRGSDGSRVATRATRS